jgi:hypothetical protein
MASNTTHFWHTTFSNCNPIQHQDLKKHDSLEEALLAALEHEDRRGPGESKIVIYFP